MTAEISPQTAPEWNERRVVTFAGMFDTHKDTGEDYPTISLAEMFALEPTAHPKGAGPAIVPSLYHDYDAREHASQRANGRFVLLCGDVDSGDHALSAIKKAAAAFAPKTACLIYSSAHSRPGDRRWRILIPLAAEQPFDTWHDAQTAFFAFMEARGIAMDHALARAAQPVYLPNVPPVHGKSGTALRGEDNAPLYFERARTPLTLPGLDLNTGAVAEGIAAIRAKRARDEQERAAIRAEAQKRRAQMPRGENSDIIEDFNAANSVAAMLELCGYAQCPRNAEDWRSPYQTSETYATRVIETKWVSLSASDAAAGLGMQCSAGCYGDAYDLYVHFKHGGDHKAAFRALHAERRAAQGSNVVYLDTPPVPEWLQDGPPAEVYQEWLAQEPDHGDHGGVDYSPMPEVSEPKLPDLSVVDAFDFEESEIPTRPWIIPGVMLSGYTHMLAAPGGTGKSLFTLQMAIALALGQPWGTFTPRRRAKTMVINVEDDLHEQRRRLAAARKVMSADKRHLLGMVHLVADTDNIIVAGFDDAKRVMVAKPIVPVLVEYIREHQIDVLIVDPFTETFEGDENDNSEVKWAMRIWRDEIAKATGCAVYLVHHTTKNTGGGAGDANIVRGAGAIVNSTRISATLMPMTKDDAALIGIDPADTHLYVRYDDAKANQSLKSGKARWFQKQSVTLDNGDEDHPADEVGALMPWTPPGMLDGISTHRIKGVLDFIEAGLLDDDGVPTGRRYTFNTKGNTKQSGRWVGTVLMDQLGMSEPQARALLKSWSANGVLVEMDYHDPVRREPAKGVFAPEGSRPGVFE